jgi:non-lysosomal glucosylceramidase
MDSKHGGTSSWMGSMYMAALSAAERMATLQGDTKSASRYANIVKVGSINQDEKLFNGEYYIQIPDSIPHNDYLTGCYTDQMLGQWWAHLLDFGWIYPKEHVRSAMSALFKYNFKTDFYNIDQYRTFAYDYEPAMLQTSWPRGGRPAPENTMLHQEEVKIGITYAVAALMMYSGLYTEAFAVTKANYDRHDGLLRTGLTDNPWSGLGIGGNPFGDECAGQFYVRPLSTWSLLLAAQKEILDGPKGVLGFDPTFMPNDHKSFFTAGEGWGTFAQKRDGKHQNNGIKLDWGKLRLMQLQLRLPDGKNPQKVEVQIGNKVIESKFSLNDQNGRLQIDLINELTLLTGQEIIISIDYI